MNAGAAKYRLEGKKIVGKQNLATEPRKAWKRFYVTIECDSVFAFCKADSSTLESSEAPLSFAYTSTRNKTE